MDSEKSLPELVSDAMEVERNLILKEEALAAHNKEFANWLKVKKRQDEQLEVLWGLVKDRMEEMGVKEYELQDTIQLKLTPSGKYKLAEGFDIKDIPDNLCEIKKTLSNKKIKASIELNGIIPNGVESTGNILRKKLL